MVLLLFFKIDLCARNDELKMSCLFRGDDTVGRVERRNVHLELATLARDRGRILISKVAPLEVEPENKKFFFS